MRTRGNLPPHNRGIVPSGSARLPDSRGYETLEQLLEALYRSGFEACELIIGVDFTKSNNWTGKRSFRGKCLHDVSGPSNPYMQVLELAEKRLTLLDDDSVIPCYGFGDVASGREKVFSFFPNNASAQGMKALLERYKEIAPNVGMSGPTTFAPLIRQAMREVYNSEMKFHILLILADGQVSEECLRDTTTAIIEASEFPLSIIMIGVGDGPWDEMQNFDDKLPERRWDNFQFVNFGAIANAIASTEDRRGQLFQHEVLEELPFQFSEARNLVGKRDSEAVQRIITRIPQDLVLDPPTPFNFN